MDIFQISQHWPVDTKSLPGKHLKTAEAAFYTILEGKPTVTE